MATHWSKIADFNLPHLYLAPRSLAPVGLHLSPCVIVRRCLPVLRFSCLVKLRIVMDGQTDIMTAYTASA